MISRMALITAVAVLLLGNRAAGAPPGTETLWYARPADAWTEALPLGNGRLGAMVFGGVPRDHLQLNEESLWAGEPVDAYPEGFREDLARVRELVLTGEPGSAVAFGKKTMTQSPTSFRSYEPLADLWIETGHGSDVANYRRELVLNTGVTTSTYALEGVVYRREAFISAVDDVLVVRLSATKPGNVDARVWLSREKDMTVTVAGTACLHMDGQIVDVALSFPQEIFSRKNLWGLECE